MSYIIIDIPVFLRGLESDSPPLIEPYFLIDPVNGNDSTGNGAPNGVGIPWKTFGKAATEMASSSTKRTYARGGTYSTGSGETFPIALTSSHANIEFRSYPNETAAIDYGSANVKGWTLNGASNVLWKGLTFKNQVSPSSNSTVGVFSQEGANSNFGIIDACRIENVSIGFVRNSGRADDWKILGNIWSNIAAEGILALTGLHRWTCAGNDVNIIGSSHNFSESWIHVYNAEDWIVEYNKLTNLGYLGISFFDGGSDVNRRNKVRYNYINGYCQGKNDGGAIYMLGRSVGLCDSDINNNYIENGGSESFPLASAIYLDDASSQYRVRNNVSINAHASVLHLHGGKDNDFSNNIGLLGEGTALGFFDDQLGCFYQTADPPNPAANMTGNTLQRNIFRSVNASLSPVLFDATTAENNWLRYSGTGFPAPTVSDNVLYQEMAIHADETSSVQSNPLFADVSIKDFTLNGGSPAYAEGFIDIPGVTDGGAPQYGLNGYNRANY